MSNAYDVVRQFEAELCRYTGAPYAVTVNSCTAALMLAVAWHLRKRPVAFAIEVRTPSGHHAMARDSGREIEIPKRTYVSVPMSIIHAGGRPTFRDENWLGAYRLRPLPVWDCARLFTSDMFLLTQFQCVSFHASKTLGIEQGGAILHDDTEADAWLRRARFDGRGESIEPKDDTITQVGFHCYMSPSVAAQGLLKLHSLPKHNAPLPNDAYPDLSQMEIFR